MFSHLMLQPLLATPALKSWILDVSWSPVRRLSLSWKYLFLWIESKKPKKPVCTKKVSPCPRWGRMPWCAWCGAWRACNHDSVITYFPVSVLPVNGRLDGLHAPWLPHRLSGEVGVGSGPVPVALFYFHDISPQNIFFQPAWVWDQSWPPPRSPLRPWWAGTWPARGRHPCGCPGWAQPGTPTGRASPRRWCRWFWSRRKDRRGSEPPQCHAHKPE